MKNQTIGSTAQLASPSKCLKFSNEHYPTNSTQKSKRPLGNWQKDSRDKRSAVLQPLMYINEVYQKWDTVESDQTFVLYADFKKIFDEVVHNKLTEAFVQLR